MDVSVDDEKSFARKALFVVFSGNYVAQIRDDIGLDCSDDKDAIFLLFCGEYFFLENRTCRPSVLLLQVRDMVDTFRKLGHEEGVLKADIVDKYLFEILEEFTKDRTNYYMHFLHEFGANPEIFNLLSDRYMNLRHLLNDRFDMDFDHIGEFIKERNLAMPKIFGYEEKSPPYLKILCEFFEAEGCPELFQRTNMIYLANVQLLKERLLENYRAGAPDNPSKNLFIGALSMDDYPTISNTKASDGATVTLVGDGKIDGVEAQSSTVLLSNEKTKPLWKNWSAIGCAIGIIGLIAVFVF